MADRAGAVAVVRVYTLYKRKKKKKKNNPKKIIFYPKGVDDSQNKNYNKNTETQNPNYNSFMEVFKMKVYKLRPVDNRKSFYGKAKVIEKDNGEKVLQSYNTEVCKITSGGEFVRLWDNYSATTMRHVNAFLSLFGIAGGGKTWWNAQTVNA